MQNDTFHEFVDPQWPPFTDIPWYHPIVPSATYPELQLTIEGSTRSREKKRKLHIRVI